MVDDKRRHDDARTIGDVVTAQRSAALAMSTSPTEWTPGEIQTALRAGAASLQRRRDIVAPPATRRNVMKVKIPLVLLLLIATALGYALGTESGRTQRDVILVKLGRKDAVDPVDAAEAVAEAAVESVESV
jgi:hypothetical protein